MIRKNLLVIFKLVDPRQSGPRPKIVFLEKALQTRGYQPR